MNRASQAGIGTGWSVTLMVVASACFTGCSYFSLAVDPVGAGQTFSAGQSPRETEHISIGTPGQTQYRVFDPNTDDPADAEQTASAFCERKEKAMNLLEVTAFTPPDEPLWAFLCVLCMSSGAAVEIFFECIEKPDVSGYEPALKIDQDRGLTGVETGPGFM
jgi:hypothetical protein